MRSIKTSVNLYRILETLAKKNYVLAYSTDSWTSKLPKGILRWASGAELIERAAQNLQKGALRSEGNMTDTLPATLPAPLRSHALARAQHSAFKGLALEGAGPA